MHVSVGQARSAAHATCRRVCSCGWSGRYSPMLNRVRSCGVSAHVRACPAALLRRSFFQTPETDVCLDYFRRRTMVRSAPDACVVRVAACGRGRGALMAPDDCAHMHATATTRGSAFWSERDHAACSSMECDTCHTVALAHAAPASHMLTIAKLNVCLGLCMHIRPAHVRTAQAKKKHERRQGKPSDPFW